jgi:hypothetical protein
MDIRQPTPRFGARLARYGALLFLAVGAAAYARRRHADGPRHIADDAGLLSPWTRGKFEEYLGQVQDETGADIRIQLHRAVPGGDIERFALQQMRLLRIGDGAIRKGMLFVYDASHRRLRIEVGPGLEGVLTDGFVGYLMREGAATFFAEDNPDLALRTTLYIMNLRLREAALGDGVNRRALAVITDSVRFAAGAGATARAGRGEPAPPIIWRKATAAERIRFAPQSTPERTYQLYLQWLREGGGQIDVPLFAPGTEYVLRRYPQTRAFHDFILYGIYGHRYRIFVRGDVAMLVYTSTPFVSPSFLRRTPAGWQWDVLAEFRNTTEAVGGSLTWTMSPSGDDYARAFADLLVDVDGYTRIAGGDNRTLPDPSRY